MRESKVEGKCDMRNGKLNCREGKIEEPWDECGEYVCLSTSARWMLLKNSRIIFLFVWMMLECLTISQQSNCQLPSTFSRDRYKVHLFLLLLTFCFPNFQCMRQQLAVIFKFESWISLLPLWKLGFCSFYYPLKQKFLR